MDKKPLYFKPEKVNDYFTDLAALPRSSGNEGQVREYIISQVEQYNKSHGHHPVKIVYYNKDAEKPGEQNIVLRRDGSGKKGNKPAVILQAHMDMVCMPSRNIFPLQLNKYTDEQGVEMLKAGGFTVSEGTSLGADDGIGIAAALAIITDPKLETGTVECLFTVQEEVDMGGAKNLDVTFLTGGKLINLDSEDYNMITYGSAGGLHVKYDWLPQAEKIPADYKTLFLEIGGLSGGHSGVNINEGRANAVKILARLLDHERRIKKSDFNLVRITSTNNRHNVIPNNAQVAFACPAVISAGILDNIRSLMPVYREEYKDTDPAFEWHAEEIGNPHYMMNADHSHNLIDLLLQIPHGPLKMMSGNHHVVESSVNLAIIEADYRRITVECSCRSAVDQAMDSIQVLHQTIAAMHGITRVIHMDTLDSENNMQFDRMKEHDGVLVYSCRYPGWQPDKDSDLLRAAREVYSEIYGESNYIIEVVHAGLEGSWIIQKYRQAGRKLECISIGPTILTPHSWNERLNTATVQSFYDCLVKIIHKVQE